MIHFWAPRETATEADVRAWDPDREPRRYATGVGHNLLELFARLDAAGLEVTLGEDAPRGTRLVVVFSKSVYQRRRLQSALRAGRQAHGRFAVIRSDAPTTWAFPVRPVIEVMPTLASVRRPWQRWLPALPQRGLVQRREDRRGRIATLAFKGSRGNFPPVILTEEWERSLAARGVTWWLDAPELDDASDQAWHDFSEVDAVLCVRISREGSVVERKPATRLINAWAAGCVPIAERDPAYEELGSEGADVFFIDSPADALEIIDRLNADDAKLAEVEKRIDARAAAFAADAILGEWREALTEAAASGVTARAPIRLLGARALLTAEPALQTGRRAAARALRAVRSRRLSPGSTP